MHQNHSSGFHIQMHINKGTEPRSWQISHGKPAWAGWVGLLWLDGKVLCKWERRDFLEEHYVGNLPWTFLWLLLRSLQWRKVHYTVWSRISQFILLRNILGKGGILGSQTECQLLETSPDCKPAPSFPILSSLGDEGKTGPLLRWTILDP